MFGIEPNIHWPRYAPALISTSFNCGEFLRRALCREEVQLDDEDDCEGAELTSNPPSPPPSRPPSPSLEPPASRCLTPSLRTTTTGIEARRQKDAAKLRKKKTRQACSATVDPLSGPRIKASHLRKKEAGARISVQFNAQCLEGSGASYIGHRTATRRGAPSTVKQLRARGIRINKWDGAYAHRPVNFYSTLTPNAVRHVYYTTQMV